MFPDQEIKYERILHSIWSEQLFSHTNFVTTSGVPVAVVRPGYLNHSDGPDFLNAVVQIGSITHHGAIEIHLNSRDWYAHNHQHDRNYNQVVLHVVADESNTRQVLTKSGDSIPTLNIRPYLPRHINELIGALSGNDLPCSNIVQYISGEAFEEQLAIAQEEYLEKKVQDFYAFFDPAKGLSEAWKNALMLSLADGLGIPHNRAAMVEAAKVWQNAKNAEERFTSSEQFLHVVMNSKGATFSRKGVRPAHRPEQRLPQLFRLMEEIEAIEFTTFIDADLTSNWHAMLGSAGIHKAGFARILFGTVFLPAHLGLSQLVFSSALRQKVYEQWQQLEVKVPDQIRKKFEVFPQQLYSTTSKNLGAVHLYHAYCKEKRCIECKVLNKAILS